jgi:protein O-GlcNAc transferase
MPMIMQDKAMTADDALAFAVGRLRAGNIGEAEEVLRQVVAHEPGNMRAKHMLGVCLSQRGLHAEALPLFADVLQSDPDNAGARNNLANALQGLHRFADALACYDMLVERDPRNPVFHGNRGNVLKELRRFDAALASYDIAISLQPEHPGLRYNRATVLNELERPAEAIADFDRAIAQNPGLPGARVNRGHALMLLRRFDEALEDFDKAIEIDPRDAYALVNRASALRELNRHEEALASCERALALEPHLAEAHANRGDVLAALGRYEEALSSYDRAIAQKPRFAEAHANRGHALRELQRHDAALASYARARELAPDLPYVTGSWIHHKMTCCDWSGLPAAIAQALAAVERGERASLPFPLLAMPSSLAQQRACARICAADRFPPQPAPLCKGEDYAHDRLRIGYFSADFHNHATAHLIAGLLERHDRSRFEVIAFSFGSALHDAWRERIERAVDRFIDVRGLPDRDVAMQARALEIDVAVDLKGHTQHARPGIFAHRPAPLQVSYLGYPGTLGAPYIDYLIADSTLILPEHRAFYDERIVTLPHSYQANDATKVIADRSPSRAELGLPPVGFVFCCFNNSFKVTPDVFDLWMRLLTAVEGSVLWLLETHSTAVGNLRLEAARRNVAPERLVFAPRVDLAAHLARHRSADLFLDTFPYNAHTTASDALWAGLPLVTCIGDTFAGRVGASLLNAVGLPELIARNPGEYEALAVRLATQPAALAAVRAKLTLNRDTHPLFDTERFTRDIESAYVTMLARRRAGLPPGHLVADAR